MTISFLHVACNRVLQYLLLNERRSPSEFLMLSLEYNNYLNPVILLLKTVLICPSSRLYLESYIAELIKFYSSYSEIECQSFINFVDVLNVTLAIFDEDTNYSLIKMQNNPNNTNNLPDVNLESYRIFSQSKRLADLRIPPAKSDTTRSLHPSV
jgi:hypothetical protein